MVLPIVTYGHPVLRKPGARIDSLTPDLLRLIDDMFDTMYESNGIGLAAQQVGHALQLAVIDVRGVDDRPSWIEIGGVAADVATAMPLVLVNPTLAPGAEMILGPEGCLSFPEVFGDISRPAVVGVKATNRLGQPFEFRCGGLLARAIQHEWDHLQGILFIDRMSADVKALVREDFERIQAETRRKLRS